jgi:D-proline reductase (dithiol) PrdB
MPEISRYCIPYTPFTGKLESSRVGIVSTAGVHLRSQPAFVAEGDTTFRLIPADATTDLTTVTHDHYDHTDARRDVNCVFPVETLRELVAAGKLGSTTPEHLCMGYSQAMREIKEKVAHEIALIARKWKSDAILLTAG